MKLSHSTRSENEPHTSRAIVVASIVPGILFLNGFYMPRGESPHLQWISDLSSFLVAPLCVLMWLSRFGGIRPSQYGVVGLDKVGRPRVVLENTLLATAVLFAIAEIIPSLAWSVLWRLGLGQNAFAEPPHIALPTDVLLRLVTIGYLCVSAAVVEEIFFRGLVRHFIIGNRPHPSLCRVASYVLVSSVTFSLCHWERGAAIVLTMVVFGIAAALMYLRSASLYPMVGAHAVVGVLVRALW